MSTDLTPVQRECLEICRARKGLTWKSIMGDSGSYLEATKLMSDLRVRGLIYDTGKRRDGAILYQMTVDGEKVLLGSHVIS